MRLLLVTNLYPPQELGGYGRSMADFAWGLSQRGHQLQVLTSDAPYLQAVSPDREQGIDRSLKLKGTYNGGVKIERNAGRCRMINAANRKVLQRWLTRGPWHGALVGNLDLLGMELLEQLLQANLPVLHHMGFVPSVPGQLYKSLHYQLVAASDAVRQVIADTASAAAEIPVVFPGARVELFGEQATGLPLSPPSPLRIAYAGLLMPSKGVHTLIEALILLHQQGTAFTAQLAGQSFTYGYREKLEVDLTQAGLADRVRFVGSLEREQLARFFAEHNVCVFPSQHPEAFGIVQAEAMASGLALVSSGVGGAAEVFENGISGLQFEPGNANHLAEVLTQLGGDPARVQQLSAAGQQRAREVLSVERSALQLEQLLVKAALVADGFRQH